MALGTARRTPRPRHGMGAYFGAGAALVGRPATGARRRTRRRRGRNAGPCNAIVMRGNGAVVAADSLLKATVLTWYLEDAARLELQVLAAGLQDDSVVLDRGRAPARATDSGAIFERMWQFMTPATANPKTDRRTIGNRRR
jgi:HCOMODA/2-hydroxy-3-carboxy-muconic semialdehyde decarboxylase